MRTTALLLTMGMAMAPLGSALGANQDARERAAKKACMTGDPAKGVEVLADLYLDTNNPTYIFNQGRCLEQNRKCEDAIERFREYLRKIGDDATQDKAEAQKHIRECQAVLGITDPPREVAPVSPPPFASERPGAGIPTVGAPPPAEVALAAGQPELAQKPGAGLRTAGIVTASAGVAGLIAGLAFNLKYNGGIGDIEAKYNKDEQDDNESYKTLAIVSYGVGAACLVGGGVLYYLGWNKGKLAAAPAPIAGNPGALIMGVF